MRWTYCAGVLVFLSLLPGCSEAPPAGDGSGPAEAGTDGLAQKDRGRHKDGRPKADKGKPCKVHCDCPQGSYCYYGKCVKDPKVPVYCCSKAKCPPGQWCIDAKGQKKICAESSTYKCDTACDCGPAHCCLDNRCVKDLLDPWRPGGKALGKRRCVTGTDATYCCAAPECHAGRYAYKAEATRLFRCHDRTTAKAQSHCGGKPCFGTACNCGLGESCVDTVSQAGPGRACLLLSGGSCVSHAVAEALFGYKSTDLLTCCGDKCTKGARCDAGWASAGRHGYQRVVGKCKACGNKVCDPGESPTSCPKDCRCGDKVCSPEEIGKCNKDCGSCGNGVCERPAESPVSAETCAKDCPQKCGDGFCTGTETKASCAKDCAGRCLDAALYPGLHRVCGDGHCAPTTGDDPETCRTCPQDCGKCEQHWTTLMREPVWTVNFLNGIWGSSATNIFVVGGEGTIVHHDGIGWNPMASGSTRSLYGVWGTSPTNVYATGSGSTLLQYDGQSWNKLPSIAGNYFLRSVWASSASDIFAVGNKQALRFNGKAWGPAGTANDALKYSTAWGLTAKAVFLVAAGGWVQRFDGKAWTQSNTGATKSQGGIWASSPTNIYVIANDTIYRSQGQGWKEVHHRAGDTYGGIWGSSASDIFVVGHGMNILPSSMVLHWDGKQWSSTYLGSSYPLSAVWGSSPSNVYAVGQFGLVARFDGKAWKVLKGAKPAREYNSVWASSATDVHVVGDFGLANRYDGKVWNRTPTSTEIFLKTVWGSSPAHVLAAGDKGSVLRYKGPQWTWERNRPDPGLTLTGLWGSSPKNIYAVGRWGLFCTRSELLRYNGSAWSSSAHHGLWLTKLWGASPKDLFVVGARCVGTQPTRPEVLRSTDGATLKISYAGPPSRPGSVSSTVLTGVWGSSATNVFVVGFHRLYPKSSIRPNGALLRFNGKSWSPAFKSRKVYLTAVRGSSASDVYAVGSRGMILRHGGSSWRPVRLDLREAAPGSYESPTFRDVWVTPKGVVFVVGSSRTVLRYCPGGSCP